ncbi:hypothetical protein DMENIID0001_017710 [Sergentomyia squamirostris]
MERDVEDGLGDTSVESEDERSCEKLDFWFYKDPDGGDHGPFPVAKMLRWRHFFQRTTIVWHFGSEKKISFEDFLILHKIHPLWVYFDEENEPLIQSTPREDVNSDSDNETIDLHECKTQNSSKDTDEVEISESEKAWNVQNPKKSSPSSNGSVSGNETKKELKKVNSENEDTSSSTSKNSDSSETLKSNADSSEATEEKESKKISNNVDISKNIPDVYKKLAEVKQGSPINMPQYSPYNKDKVGKENLQPLEEIRNPQNSGYDPNKATYMRNYYTEGQNWTGRQTYNAPNTSMTPYRAVPPPFPAYMTTPPPPAYPMLPMRPMEPYSQHMANISRPRQNLMNYPPSQYYVHGPPAPPASALPMFGNTPYSPPRNHQPYNYNNYNQYNYQQGNYQYQNYNQHQNYQNRQSGTLHEITAAYHQANSKNDKDFAEFCENLIEKYMNITEKEKEKFYRENQLLRQQNEELKSKVEADQKAQAQVNKDVSFAELVASSESASGQEDELKSFWDSMPKPTPPTAPPKKINKYPAGYVGEGTKKKAKPTMGIEEFNEWSLNTLNYISENKLNTDQLRIILDDFDTIAYAERYIKMWLEEINPKLWKLYSEKLKKYREDGTTNELNSPARANPYEIEKQKQKEKLQKRELFGSSKDLNTINISRHISKQSKNK